MMTSRHADTKQYISAFRDHLLSPPPPGGGLISFKPIWLKGEGGLIETGGYLWGRVFNCETTMVSVLQEELEYKVEKLKYKTF